MTDEKVLGALAEHFGIIPSFRDLAGVTQPTSRETKLTLLHANGIDTSTQSILKEQLRELEQKRAERICKDEVIVDAGKRSVVQISEPVEWSLSLEEGTACDGELQGKCHSLIDLPALPAGIHTLRVNSKRGAQSVTIIAAPRAAPSLAEQTGRTRIWGINTALYGLHSDTTCGLGTFTDLALVAEAISGHGASFLGVNPVHSMGWADEETISPYSPSHRGYLNTAHIDLGGADGDSDNELSTSTILDYQAHRLEQNRRLENAFLNFKRSSQYKAEGHASFAAYQAQEGQALRQFAQFEALSEIHGPDWRCWPTALQTSTSEAVQEFERAHNSRIEFHIWMQWLADKQLGDAQTRAKTTDMAPGLYLDLAVGSRRGGAETWCEKSSIAQGVSIGAPPDHLSPAGQNWDLAAFAPVHLKDSQYRSFRTILARTLRHAGILRIDHVLGLNRSYWIPDNGASGGYIRQPFEALLAVVAIEAHRAGTIIVGEDLGLVPDGFRKRLHERGLYSYSVLQYEKDKNGRFKNPKDLQKNSLTCFGTHDTPTLHGYMKQRDIDWWRKLDWIDNAGETELRVARAGEIDMLQALGVNDASPRDASPGILPKFNRISATVHDALANSPVAMVSVQLDDVLGEIEAQNLPGTIDEHPNWKRRTSISVEQLSNHRELKLIASLMRKAKRLA